MGGWYAACALGRLHCTTRLGASLGARHLQRLWQLGCSNVQCGQVCMQLRCLMAGSLPKVAMYHEQVLADMPACIQRMHVDLVWQLQGSG